MALRWITAPTRPGTGQSPGGTRATDAMADLQADAHACRITRIFPGIGETGTTPQIIGRLENSA